VLRVALLSLAFVAFAASAQPATYRIDPDRTRAEFDVEHLGVFRAHGQFTSVAGTLQYDAAAHAGAIDLAIAVSSVATGWGSRDAFLRGTSMFDASRFPRMTFVSRRFDFADGRLARVEGDLTLRDVTRPVTLTVRSLRCEAGACVAEAGGAIRRRDYAMDAWWPLISDEVDLWFRLTAVRE
jgi:polyisoprenoid-binding protein YceI